MKMQTVFLDRRALRQSTQTDIVRTAYPSRWGGHFARSPYDSRTCYSAAAMRKKGFQLVELPKEEVDRIKKLQTKRIVRMEARTIAYNLEQRAEAVAKCLRAEPIPLQVNEGGNPFVRQVVNLSGTPMIEAYTGCGSGTAYLQSGKLIAYHYGHQQPANAPKGEDIQVRRCELSGTQVCL